MALTRFTGWVNQRSEVSLRLTPYMKPYCLYYTCLFLLSWPAGACDWTATMTFCEGSRSAASRPGVEQAVVRLRGLEILSQLKPDGSLYAPVFRAQVIESYGGQFTRGQILHLWTGDDWDCNGPVDYLEPGTEYIVGFPDTLTDRSTVTELSPDAPADLYHFWGWSNLVHRIWTHNGEDFVYPQEFGQEAVSIPRLIAAITKCQPNVSFQPSVAIFPNPATDWLRATFGSQRVLSSAIYDLHGRFTHKLPAPADPTEFQEYDVRWLPPGPYVLHLHLEQGLTRHRFLVH